MLLENCRDATLRRALTHEFVVKVDIRGTQSVGDLTGNNFVPDSIGPITQYGMNNSKAVATCHIKAGQCPG